MNFFKKVLRKLKQILLQKASEHLNIPTREDQIRKYVNRTLKGIEVAPWHKPIVSKKSGYQVDILDVCDTEELIKKCREDSKISSSIDNIEEVDFVASALDIDKAVENKGGLESYDYIISSHNFEHLPNPIQFLQACGKVLKQDGYLSMAIPDRKCTFDYFRGLTRTVDFLEAYFEKRDKPTPYQIYDFSSNFANNVPNSVLINAHNIEFRHSLDVCFTSLQNLLISPDKYVDIHVSVFSPQSFKLIISELIMLELIPFRLIEVIETNGSEFYVHMQNVGYQNIAQYKISQKERAHLYAAVVVKH
jgi:SAM-dependent methyltransferase